jgi:hypothetical protein
MVHEDITMFQEIWKQINEEQGEASLLNIRKYLQRHEDIDMGWINMHWGVAQVLNDSISFPHAVMLALDKSGRTKVCFLIPNSVHNRRCSSNVILGNNSRLHSHWLGHLGLWINESKSSNKE